jgi:hypothetical protein
MRSPSWFPLAAVLTLGFLAGCKDKEAPPPMPVAEVPQTINNAFDQASPEAKAAAAEALKSVQNDEQGAAIEALEALARQTAITPEQREAAARAAIAVRAKILEDAAKGNAAAQAYLDEQRARK